MDRISGANESEKLFQNVTETPRRLTRFEWKNVARKTGMVAALIAGFVVQDEVNEYAKNFVKEKFPGIAAMGMKYPTLTDVCVARGPEGHIFVDMTWPMKDKTFAEYQQEMPASVLINYHLENFTIRCNYRPARELVPPAPQPQATPRQEIAQVPDIPQVAPNVSKEKPRAPVRKPQQPGSGGNAWNEWGNQAFK